MIRSAVAANVSHAVDTEHLEVDDRRREWCRQPYGKGGYDNGKASGAERANKDAPPRDGTTSGEQLQRHVCCAPPLRSRGRDFNAARGVSAQQEDVELSACVRRGRNARGIARRIGPVNRAVTCARGCLYRPLRARGVASNVNLATARRVGDDAHRSERERVGRRVHAARNVRPCVFGDAQRVKRRRWGAHVEEDRLGCECSTAPASRDGSCPLRHARGRVKYSDVGSTHAVQQASAWLHDNNGRGDHARQ